MYNFCVNNNLNINSFVFANSKTMKPLLFSFVISLLFFAGCKKEDSKLPENENDNSSVEKKSMKYLKAGNIWIYKVLFSGDILNKRFDTIYISNSYIDEQSFEVFEFRIKTVQRDENDNIENVDRLLGVARESEGLVEVIEGYFLGKEIRNEGEYWEINKKGGGGCETNYKYPNTDIPILYEYNGRKMNAILNTTEGYCDNILEHTTNYIYADGIGFVKRETRWHFGTYTNYTNLTELIYFSELQ